MEPPGRPGSAAGFHGAHYKGDVAAAPPLIDAMSPVRRLAAPAALPDAAKDASSASQGAASRGSVFGSRTQREPSRNSHRRLRGPPASPMAAIPRSGRASASRPEMVGPLPPPRRQALVRPERRTSALLGASNSMRLSGGVTDGVSGNWPAETPAR